MVDWSDKRNWCLGNWQGYVLSGKTRDERVARLAESPEDMRDRIRAHVETAYKIKSGWKK